MNVLDQLLSTEPYIVLDGAIGTVLMGMGLEPGAPPEAWNLDQPEAIQRVHREYIEAGSKVILTNSFGGTHYRLNLHELQDQVVEINRAAAENARIAADAAGTTVIVAGSMGPTGELLSPLGDMTYQDAVDAFAEQANGLSQGGAELLWVETMSDLNEVRAAVEGARTVSDLPLVATMTFDTNGHTMMGVTPAAALEALGNLDLVAIGGNCGNGPGEVESVISKMRKISPDLMLVAKSNAGMPYWIEDELRYDGTPEVMAEYAVKVRDLGARLIGACCGSTPDHVRAMATALAQQPMRQLELTEEVAPDQAAAPVARTRTRRRRRANRATGQD